ncbi:transglutaminase family protein [Compostimonas suwonensis]|uniref:Transglutaminase-like putative cysteine protease n=1 Tax=Compostimonas suwonensis TaxID=1048394 RepID=A0A2M9C3M9_9MICO|nr:transglutaminase family protein [Compostimonas suwonensis]PJJ65134.1 transglutaminase-like putative cysteine protease [Compostimonas suwonensis]
MNRLRIKHVTGFAYQGEVSASHNEARMLPASGDSQLVLYSNIDIHPVSSSHDYVDYWGTRVNAFEVLSPHDELSLTATSLVEVRARAHEEHDITWEELAAWATVAMEYEEQERQTAKTEPPEEVVELVREIVSSSSGPCEAALAICRAVGERVEYVQGVTSVQTTATEAWAKRKGVCQDIAHIALGALRSAGIPARYVSGYLHPKPDAAIGETVTGESHAWVEWFCGQWRGYDPTNLIDIGDRHVAVGRGRDYNDVAPLRGVYAGSSGSRLFVTVEITREA